MPHKRNPILSERIAGLARLLRGYAHTALEDQPLWHERDISHSSAERVILPDATILLDYMLVRMTGLIDGLIVRSERMRENIARGLGLHASSRVLVALVEKGGIGREEAYAIVQRAALRAADERAPLRDLLAVDPGRRAAPVARATSTPASTRPRSCATSGAVIDRLDAIAADDDPPAGERGRPMLTAEPFLRSGKVRDLYDLPRRPAAARRLGPDQRVRRRPADRDPRQGPGADRAVAVLVRGDRRDRAQPPARHGRRDHPRRLRRVDRRRERRARRVADRWAARPCPDLPAIDGRPDRGGRPRLPRRLRLEGIPGDAARSAGSRCRPGCARATDCRSRSSRRRPRPSQGEHDENIDFDAMIDHIGGSAARPIAGPLAEPSAIDRPRALRAIGARRIAERAGILAGATRSSSSALA